MKNRIEDISIGVLVFTAAGFAVCVFILFAGIIAAIGQ